MFDENGDRKGLTQIEQLQGDTERRVGVYDPSNINIKSKITWDRAHTVIWVGEYKHNHVGVDTIYVPIRYVYMSTGIYIYTYIAVQ